MKITRPGILIFLGLVVVFFLWFGIPHGLPTDSIIAKRRVTNAWLYSLLFVFGAGTACFGEREYGMFPPSSLRWLFIILGSGIMIIAVTSMHLLRTAAP
jgi:hypothetical protein